MHTKLSQNEHREGFVKYKKCCENVGEIEKEDPFYSDSNIQYLEKIVQDIEDGIAKFAEHELIDEDEPVPRQASN